jgi:hypothetical protein
MTELEELKEQVRILEQRSRLLRNVGISWPARAFQ